MASVNPEQKNTQPKGQLAIQTMAMPANTNANGDIFGGWLVSQMDLAGSVIAGQRAKSRVVTVAIDAMSFYRPVSVGSVLSCYADILRVGKTSLRLRVQAWIRQHHLDTLEQVTEAEFTFVAIDATGKPQAVDR